MTEEEFEMMDNKLKDSCLRYLLDISNQNDGKEAVKIEKVFMQPDSYPRFS